MSSSDHSNRQAEGASSPEPLSTIRMRVVQDPVGTAHYISGLHAEVERLRRVLRLIAHGCDEATAGGYPRLSQAEMVQFAWGALSLAAPSESESA